LRSRSPSGPVTWFVAILVWAVGFLLPVTTLIITNDHFDRISRARQVARYGELPFRDFFDPGYFMAVLSSAALQRVLGDNLLADMLLDATFIATGTVIVFLLARRASSSIPIGLAAATLALLTLPRLYDFDKVLFYPLGVLLCWRYVDRSTTRNVVLMGAGLVAGALFRYDTGVYIGAASLVTLAIVHGRDWAVLTRRVLVLAAAVTCTAAPFLLFVQMNGGIVNAADQVATYARREAARTRISSWPRFTFGPLVTINPWQPPSYPVRIRWAASVDDVKRQTLASRYSLQAETRYGPPADRTWTYQLRNGSHENVSQLVANPEVEDTDGIDRAQAAVPPEPIWMRTARAVAPQDVRILPGSWDYKNGSAFLYYLLLALPVISVVSLVTTRTVDRQEYACVAALIVMCVLLDRFILRDPVGARVGGMAGPLIVLGVWLATRAWRTGPLAAAAVVVSLGLTVWAVSMTADWATHLRSDRASFERVKGHLRAVAQSPPTTDTMPYRKLTGLIGYLRDCTTRDDRVYASWFVPDLYFYAQRGFAGGMVVTFGEHWSEPRYQQRIVATLAGQSVPIAIIDAHNYSDFQAVYPDVDRYLRTYYHVAGEMDFDNPDVGPRGYRVLVRNDRDPLRTHPASSMPCFR